jgi:hypothetical protein
MHSTEPIDLVYGYAGAKVNRENVNGPKVLPNM